MFFIIRKVRCNIMRIYLRTISKDDNEVIVKWRNARKVAEHCLDKRIVTLESHIKFYKENIETGRYKQFIVERIEENLGVCSYPIATVYLKDLD